MKFAEVYSGHVVLRLYQEVLFDQKSILQIRGIQTKSEIALLSGFLTFLEGVKDNPPPTSLI
jgi:hypothetical protein